VGLEDPRQPPVQLCLRVEDELWRTEVLLVVPVELLVRPQVTAYGEHHRHRQPHPVQHPLRRDRDLVAKRPDLAHGFVPRRRTVRRVDRLLRRGQHQGLLVREDPEDRPLRDTSGLRDLTGRDLVAPLDQQRQHRMHDRLPALVR
jgi:hypothetical protein